MGNLSEGDQPVHNRIHSPPLSNLTTHEAAYIAQFLTNSQKLNILAFLNKSWNDAVHLNHSWTQFPARRKDSHHSQFISFFDKFITLEGIAVSEFPGNSINPLRMAKLRSASCIGILDLHLPYKFLYLAQQNKLLGKMTTLDMNFELLENEDPDASIAAINTLFSSQFLDKLATLKHLSITVEGAYSYIFEEEVKMNLEQLKSLEELEIDFSRFDDGQKRPATVFNFPHSLHTLFLSIHDSLEVNPAELHSLPNLRTLRLGRVNNLKQYLESMNQSVVSFGCHNLESEWIGQFRSNLMNLRRLQLLFQSHDLEISNLPHLEEIVIDYFCWGEIHLSDLPGLQRLDIRSQTIQFRNGITQHPLIIKDKDHSTLSLSDLSHFSGYETHISTKASSSLKYLKHYFLEQINLSIEKPQDRAKLQANQSTFEVINIWKQQPMLSLALPQLKSVCICDPEYYQWPLDLFFDSPKLHKVSIHLKYAKVQVALGYPLKYLEASCKEIIFPSPVDIDILALNIKAIQAATQDCSFYQARSLDLNESAALKDFKIKKQFSFNRLVHLEGLWSQWQVLVQIIKLAPKLKQLRLKGVVTKKAQIRCPQSLRILDLLQLRNSVPYLRAVISSKKTQVLVREKVTDFKLTLNL